MAKSEKAYVAAVKIRSAINANAKVKGILHRLGLRKKLTLVVFKDTPSLIGQLREVKDYVTYGEIDKPFLEKLVEARGKEYKGRLADSKHKFQRQRFLLVKGKRIKPYFALHPPRGGFERGGIKKPYSRTGALGDRGKEIVKLIERML